MGDMEVGLIIKVEAGKYLNKNVFSCACFQYVKMFPFKGIKETR